MPVTVILWGRDPPALMARAGFEKTERDNVYNGMTLREYARMSLTERGIGVSSYNPM